MQTNLKDDTGFFEEIGAHVCANDVVLLVKNDLNVLSKTTREGRGKGIDKGEKREKRKRINEEREERNYPKHRLNESNIHV